MMPDSNLDLARFNMIEQQIRPWDVLDQRVLDVMSEIPRDRFVSAEQIALAYADIELPLPHGESMLAPKVEGRLLQSVRIQPTDVILEIGTGSGYLTACLATLGSHVFSVDFYEDFTQSASERLDALEVSNVTLWSGDASQGWHRAPELYDVIVVEGSLPEYDRCFEQQLKPGGRLFLVVGESPVMEAMLVTRIGEQSLRYETLFETELKPLIGREKLPEFLF